MSAFKPGDIALVMGPDEKWRTCIRAISNDGWYDEDGAHDADAEVHHVRPLIVIDPEDREQTVRLGNLIAICQEQYRGSTYADHVPVREALRSFAAPPKPPEPMGDGAVVEDRVGNRWVRICGDEPDRESKPWRRRGYTARDWAHINAVRVLSEGVRP